MNKYFIVVYLLLSSSLFTVFCKSKPENNIKLIKGNGSSNPHEFIKYKGKVYFNAYTPQYGPELWMTDGTTEGTVLLKDATPGTETNSGISTNLAVVNDTLFFATVTDIWKSDGTPDGTVKIKTLASGYNMYHYVDQTNDICQYNFFASAGGLYYFTVNDHPYFELWKSNGQTEGTVAVDSFKYLDYFYAFNGKLIFAASKTGYKDKVSLWVSDGTKSGTKCVKANLSPVENDDYPWNYTIFQNKLFFTAVDTTGDIGIYYTDGTSEGTVLVKNRFGYDYNNFTVMNGYLYFTVDSSNTTLWKTDGTTGGTILIKEIYNSNCGNCKYNLTHAGDKLYFNDFDGNNLWISDGSTVGTYILKSVPSSDYLLDWNSLTDFKGKLYFSAEIFNNNLWVSDGTEEGTKLISPILITDDSKGYYPNIFVNGDYMLINAYDSIHGYELWKSDGTTDGTILLKDIYDTTLTGIKNFKINPLMTLYPNPAGDRIRLKFSSNYQGQVEIAIMNFLGQTMQTWKGELKNDYVKEMSLENYNPGFYFVKTKYDNQEVYLPFIKR